MKKNWVTDESKAETCLAIVAKQLDEIREHLVTKGVKNISITAIDALKTIRADLNDVCTWLLSEKYKKTNNSDTCTQRLAEKYKKIHNPERVEEINTTEDVIEFLKENLRIRLQLDAQRSPTLCVRLHIGKKSIAKSNNIDLSCLVPTHSGTIR